MIPLIVIVERYLGISVDNLTENRRGGGLNPAKGQITVFLSLLLLILLSFFVAAIASAQSAVRIWYGENSLHLSMQGLYTNYCRPLWDSYHLFMLEGESKEALTATLEGYQSDTTGPFLSHTNAFFSIEETTPFLDNQAEIYKNQMIAYMKYHMTDAFFEKAEAARDEEQQNQEAVTKEKEALDQLENRAKLEKRLLLIIRRIEGAVVVNGEVQVESSFIKQISPKEITPLAVGVDQSILWEKLQDFYISYEDVSVSKCRRVLYLIKEVIKDIEQLEQNQSFDVESQSLYAQVIEMKGTLRSNQLILEEYLEECQEEEAYVMLQNYQIQSLHFEYGQLTLEKPRNPLKLLQKSIGSNLLSLVVEDENQLYNRELPQKLLLFQGSKEQTGMSISKQMKNMDADDVGSVGEPLAAYQATSRSKASDALFENAYLQTHFSNYCSSQETVYHYEQEYLLAGGKTEKEALANVLEQLLLQRTMINFAALVFDKEISNKAYITALALVGYTGMEALVEVVKTSILLCYAMEEGIIELALLLKGEEIPIMKDKGSFLLSYEELLIFGRSLIKDKVAKYQRRGGASYDYPDALKVLFLIKGEEILLSRSLALIEGTMKEKYDTSFSLENGIFGMKVKALYTYPDEKNVEVLLSYSY